jgi:hypothetical protein
MPSQPSPADSSKLPATGLGAELEAPLLEVEHCLADLGEALRQRDGNAIELHASDLHKALASAVERFSEAARSGAVPPVLRTRLATASGQVAAQRESLARATAALDRAIDVLMPSEKTGVYSARGTAERVTRTGVIQA